MAAMKTALCSLLSCVVLVAPLMAAEEAPYNVLFIISDDLRASVLPDGHPQVDVLKMVLKLIVLIEGEIPFGGPVPVAIEAIIDQNRFDFLGKIRRSRLGNRGDGKQQSCEKQRRKTHHRRA